MKVFSMIFLVLITLPALAEVSLPDFHYTLTDIISVGETKERLFSKLNRKMVKTGSSICSNRALIWTFDMKRNDNIDAAKIYLFYTGKNGEVGSKKWWYHVSPVVNERGQMWVIDGGFPGFINRPMQVGEWMKKFVNTTNCKMMKHNERELFELMFKGMMFPEYTPQYGAVDCYAYIAPGAFWTPATVAMGVLQENADGEPIRFTRDHYDMDELYQACKEAASGRIGGIFGGPKKKCKEYLGIPDDKDDN
jgi:hypothetical protein